VTYPFSADLGHAHDVAPGALLGEILANPLTYVSLVLAVVGILYASSRYRNGLPDAEAEEPTRGIRGLLFNRYYVTQLVYEPLGNIFAVGIARLSDLFDRRAIDGAVNGVARVADWKGAWMRRWQNGNLTTYMASIAVGAAFLLVFILAFVRRWWI
jgi:NADH:ubiquinone oxidoreductase subunit 5 (subunit L)/multisubunit Na+/H+ antiporter MnhA subunit